MKNSKSAEPASESISPLEDQGTRKIPFWRIALYYSILFFGAMVFAEFFLGFFDRQQIMVQGNHPQMVYGFYPNRTGISSTPEFHTAVHTSEEALRSCKHENQGSLREDHTSGGNSGGGTEGDQPSSNGEQKQILFFLGDSFTEGWGVRCEDAYPELVGQWIGNPAVVKNGGIHGGSFPYFLLRNRFYQKLWKPQITVIQVFDNDLDDMDRFARFMERDSSGRIVAIKPPPLLFLPASGFTQWIRESMLYRTTRRAVNIIKGTPLPIKYYRPGKEPDYELLTHEEALQRFGSLEPLKDLDVDYNGQFGFYKYESPEQVKKDPLWRARFQTMEKDLNRLIEDVKNSGSVPVLVYIPAMEVFAPGGIRGDHVDGGQNPVRKSVDELRRTNPFYQTLSRIGKEQRISFVDGQMALHSEAEGLYFPGDAHLNREGHRRMAKALLPVLQGILKE